MSVNSLVYAVHPSKWIGAAGRCCLLMLGLAIATPAPAQDSGGEGLFGQMAALQQRLNIEIVGWERIQNEPKLMAYGNPEQQLQQLLASFNHVISRDTKGRIERVVIINKKQPQTDTRIVLPTHREGNHLLVAVMLSGDGRVWQNSDLIIDTGADLVVLPASMVARLGIDPSTLTTTKMQTANGVVAAKVGVLTQIKMAGETLDDVKVAFIGDKQLSGNGLLGMSVLGRYRINIDDSAHLVTLFKK